MKVTAEMLGNMAYRIMAEHVDHGGSCGFGKVDVDPLVIAEVQFALDIVKALNTEPKCIVLDLTA